MFENREKFYDKTVHFENEDIIITDPCYVIRENPYPCPPLKSEESDNTEYGMDTKLIVDRDDPYYKWEEENNDWEKCNCGIDMERLGITNYIARDTIYGDWSCTVYNADTKEEMGNFCADSGMVAVFSLKEVLKYNPDFDYYINRLWTTATIKNFTGDVHFAVSEHDVSVVGKGNVNFVTEQTGF